MIFTLYYMYATLIQWWRLSSLKNKLAGTLGPESALVVCQRNQLTESKDRSCIENLLFDQKDRIGYTLVPKRTLSLKNYIQLPDTLKYFPIHVYESEMVYESPIVHLLLVADLNNYSYGIGADSLQVETLGYPLGWNAENNLSIIVKSDLNGLTKLVASFSKRPVTINYGLELLKVETINVEDHPLIINYENALRRERKLKHTVAPKQWNTFVSMVRGLSSKINVRKKITESKGTSSRESKSKHDDAKKVPVSEVKPIKKELKGEYGRHLDTVKRSHRSEKDSTKSEHKKRSKTVEKKEELPICAVDGSKIKIEVEEPKVEKIIDSAQTSNSVGIPVGVEGKEDVAKSEKTEEKVKEKEIAAKMNGQEANSSEGIKKKEVKKSKKLAVKSKSAEETRSKNRDDAIKPIEANNLKFSKRRDKESEVKEELLETTTSEKEKPEKKIKSETKDLKTSGQTEESIKSKSKEHHKAIEKKHHKEESKTKESSQYKNKATKTKVKEEKVELLESKPMNKEEFKSEITEKKKAEDVELKLVNKEEKQLEHIESNPTKDENKVEENELKNESSKKANSKEALNLQIPEPRETMKLETNKSSRETVDSAVPTTSGVKTVPKKAERKEITDIKKDKLSILVKRRSLKLMKPPNVLIYADSLDARDNVKRVLQSVLNKDKYTVYDLPITGSLSGHQPTSPVLWMDSATLLVVCGSVPPNLIPQFLQYLVTGGQLLCLCSDLLYSILHTFTTAEVRENELVRFSYEEWNQIRMMHHIFCYQASPAKKQFSKDSDSGSQSHSNGSSPIAPRTPNTVEIQHNNKTYTIQVQVLGSEETWQTPSILLAIVKSTQGKAIFSQVHLEIDPTQYEYDENTFNALKQSNPARLEILKHLLSTHLGVDCDNSLADAETAYTPAYFLGRHELKQELLTTNKNISNRVLQSDKIAIHFCGKDAEVPNASSTVLPVLIHLCPANFSTVQYFENLKTESIGRLAIYSDVMTSSQHLLMKKLKHGLVILPRQQTNGTGRGGNKWLSPQGCAMFSTQLHIPIESELGRYIPLVQHLVMIAVISAVRSQPGYENIEIGIKWPNDLYAGGKIKIGGLITSTTMDRQEAICNVGVGINLTNTSPTTCINTLIEQYNQLNKTQLSTFTYEQFLALVFNELEDILNAVQKGNVQYLYDLYYKYWLHSDAEIIVFTREGISKHVKIIGIDDYGFLKVKSSDGTVSNVQPDGNTFDMLQGLIAPKLI